jgi:hypothetical protein
MRPYLEKPFIKIGLVEWLKLKALSSSPSITKKKKQQFFCVEHIYTERLMVYWFIAIAADLPTQVED